jgi:hypothetical protein
VTQNVGVCIQRRIEAGMRAAAIQSRNGASAATAAGAPASASRGAGARLVACRSPGTSRSSCADRRSRAEACSGTTCPLRNLLVRDVLQVPLPAVLDGGEFGHRLGLAGLHQVDARDTAADTDVTDTRVNEDFRRGWLVLDYEGEGSLA